MERNLDWLNNGMRVMQYNLQVRDTQGMDPEKIALQTEESASNVVVINVGGIYAWYASKVKYHHINEYLPKDRDLLKELIDAFHKRNIKFIARFDFSLADDSVYLEHPEWFCRDKDLKPMIAGASRMGGWNQLLTTCSLGGYRGEDVAVPILNEVLDNYDIDGIFINAPTAQFCHCDHCQEEYEKRYGKKLPEKIEDLEHDWLTSCTKENINILYKAIKKKTDSVPLILYYAPFTEVFMGMWVSHRDSIYDRLATADYICCEAQDVISMGQGKLPYTEKPSLSMKAGFEPVSGKKPFGIIHSCPGMDWRHVGMPKAEYLPWMAQIPASNGVLWHSVTGYPDTITDSDVMASATLINTMAQKTESYMQGASSYADVLLLWDGSSNARKMGTILMKAHIPFDLMHEYSFRKEKLSDYTCLISPKGFLELLNAEDRAAVAEYVSGGGHFIAEEINKDIIAELSPLFGVKKQAITSEDMKAAYINLDKRDLFSDIKCDKVSMSGRMLYTALSTGESIATLIPPFAPVDVVGRPPERASLPVASTEIPVAVFNAYGKGSCIFLPFALSELAVAYGMEQHYAFLKSLVKASGGDLICTDAPHDVQMTAYTSENKVLLHCVNEVGQRPLMDNINISRINVDIALPDGFKVRSVRQVIAKKDLDFSTEENHIRFEIQELSIWEMVAINSEEE